MCTMMKLKQTKLKNVEIKAYSSLINRLCTKIGNEPKKSSRRLIKVYRFGGVLSNEKPRYQTFDLDVKKYNMVLDVMIRMKELDPSFTFRRSCREGICGSCAINLQGRNTLACTAYLPKEKTIYIRPLPHMYIIKDLVVDLSHFYNAYQSIKPNLIRKKAITPFGASQYAQSIEDSRKIDSLYECILCACCSTACPSYWWNGRRFLGPSALLSAYRWIIDSRDEHTIARLSDLRDDFKAFRCHTIMNCTLDCPKALNPAFAIGKLKMMISGLRKKVAPVTDPMKFAGEKLDQTAKCN